MIVDGEAIIVIEMGGDMVGKDVVVVEHSWSFQKQSKAVEMHAAHEKKCKHRVPVGRYNN